MSIRNQSDITIIKPSKGWLSLKLAELWRHRELFYFLAWRDIKVRYKQTILGVAWAVINPVMQMAVWAFVFGKIAKLPSQGIPYVLVTLSGTLVWSYFSEIVNGSSGSLITNTNLITKIYFPRIIIPLSIALRALLDFAIAFLVFMVMALYFKVTPSYLIFVMPFFILTTTLTAVGFGLWVAAVSVKYRDLAKILPYFIQIVFFLTPVAYLNSVIPQKYQWLYYFNPIAGAIEGFRWSLLGTYAFWPRILLSSILALTLFVFGVIYFRGMEKTFADTI